MNNKEKEALGYTGESEAEKRWKNNCLAIGVTELEVMQHKALQQFPKPEERRKMIQLVVNGDVIFGLCNDGTAWRLNYLKALWEEILPIPQPEPEPHDGPY